MPVSNPISALVCLGGDEELVTALAGAVPGAAVRRADADSVAHEPDSSAENTLLVCCDQPEVEVSRWREARDRTGLPRWAVVNFSSADLPAAPESEVIPRSQWTEAALGRLLSGALELHRLRRDNARLRGELLTFGSRIAHDLRTPLGGIVTSAEMLREVLSEAAPAEVPLIQPIVESADGLAALIERTSFFAKAVSAPPRLERFDMGKPFWNAFEQLESRILRVGATVTQPPGWPQIEGCVAWMQVIWRTLLANALQHGETAVRIEANWVQEGDGYRFWLWNSGTIAAAKIPTLFHPFHLLHSPSAPRGLGLPITRRLVELQGGTCSFDVPAGGGARFSFHLPAQPVASAPKPVPVT